MKKIITLFVLTLLLTGCDINYKLVYKNDVFNEEIVIKNYLNDEDQTAIPSIESLKNDGYYFDYDENYKFEQTIKDKKNNLYDITLKAVYNEVSYDNSGFLNNCFEFHTFEETDDYYYISLYGTFYCENDKTTFNLISDRKVILHNANKVSGGRYIWNLSKVDFLNEGIRFQISKDLKAKNNMVDIVFLVIYLSLFSGVCYLIYWCNKNPDKTKRIYDEIINKLRENKKKQQNKF